MREHILQSACDYKLKSWGISSGNLGKKISLSSQCLVSDSLFENKAPAPGEGKLIGSRKPQTRAVVTRVARIGERKKLVCIAYLVWPDSLDLQNNSIGLHTSVQRDDVPWPKSLSYPEAERRSNPHLFVMKADIFSVKAFCFLQASLAQ